MIGRIAAPRGLRRSVVQGRAAESLVTYLHQTKNDGNGHEMARRVDGWELNIGHLDRVEKRLMALTTLALRDGSLKRINAGLIVGPKVLSLVDRLRAEAEKDKLDVTLTGSFRPAFLYAQFEVQRAEANPKGHPRYWSPSEVADFERTFEDLGVREHPGLQPLSDELHRFELNVTGGLSATRVQPW